MKKYTLDGVVFILTLFVFSGIIPLIIPTVLIWNHKKDKVKGISVHYRDVISFQLMVWIGILAGLWIYWKVNVLIPLIGVFLFNALMSIINTLRVVSMEPYSSFSFFKSEKKGQPYEQPAVQGETESSCPAVAEHIARPFRR